MAICLGFWELGRDPAIKTKSNYKICVWSVYTCRGPCIGPTGFVHKRPRRWGDSEAQPGPSTEDWNACQLVKG